MGTALDDRASAHFSFRDLCHCSETWRRTGAENTPQETETFAAIAALCEHILEPLQARFEALELTYGFAGPGLTRAIRGRIAPRLDQHAGHERTRSGQLICPRLGQAVDLRARGHNAYVVARYVAEATPFDRLYLYGPDRPLHVSYGPAHTGAIVSLKPYGERLMPRPLAREDLIRLAEARG